eukprot:358139-Chlamydomonas_euryale.AAC.5
MEAYCNKKAVNISNIRFLYNGAKLASAQTPAMSGFAYCGVTCPSPGCIIGSTYLVFNAALAVRHGRPGQYRRHDPAGRWLAPGCVASHKSLGAEELLQGFQQQPWKVYTAQG